MAKGNRSIEVRVDDVSRDRWTAAARDRGYSLSEFVRVAVDDLIERESAPPRGKKPRKTAAAPEPSPKGRTGMCEHRRPPETFCPKCGS